MLLAGNTSACLPSLFLLVRVLYVYKYKKNYLVSFINSTTFFFAHLYL